MKGLEYVLSIYNMQQKDLAEKLNIGKQNITLWLKGRSIPKKHLITMSEIFNTPVEYFEKELNIHEELLIQRMRISSVVCNPKEGIALEREILIAKLRGIIERKESIGAYDKCAYMLNILDKAMEDSEGATEFNATWFVISTLASYSNLSTDINGKDFRHWVMMIDEFGGGYSQGSDSTLDSFTDRLLKLLNEVNEYGKTLERIHPTST